MDLFMGPADAPFCSNVPCRCLADVLLIAKLHFFLQISQSEYKTVD